MKMISCMAIAGAWLAFAPTAQAQIQCGPVQVVAEQLSKLYGEVVFAAGVSTNQSVKFLGNSRTGTWTMVAIRPDGTACIIANGDGLEVMKLAFAQTASR